MMNCCIEKKKAREEMAHKSQSADTDEFETGNSSKICFIRTYVYVINYKFMFSIYIKLYYIEISFLFLSIHV